jgi:hypothetical protein
MWPFQIRDKLIANHHTVEELKELLQPHLDDFDRIARRLGEDG